MLCYLKKRESFKNVVIILRFISIILQNHLPINELNNFFSHIWIKYLQYLDQHFKKSCIETEYYKILIQFSECKWEPSHQETNHQITATSAGFVTGMPGGKQRQIFTIADVTDENFRGSKILLCSLPPPCCVLWQIKASPLTPPYSAWCRHLQGSYPPLQKT